MTYIQGAWSVVATGTFSTDSAAISSGVTLSFPQAGPGDIIAVSMAMTGIHPYYEIYGSGEFHTITVSVPRSTYEIAGGGFIGQSGQGVRFHNGAFGNFVGFLVVPSEISYLDPSGTGYTIDQMTISSPRGARQAHPITVHHTDPPILQQPIEWYDEDLIPANFPIDGAWTIFRGMYPSLLSIVDPGKFYGSSAGYSKTMTTANTKQKLLIIGLGASESSGSEALTPGTHVVTTGPQAFHEAMHRIYHFHQEGGALNQTFTVTNPDTGAITGGLFYLRAFRVKNWPYILDALFTCDPAAQRPSLWLQWGTHSVNHDHFELWYEDWDAGTGPDKLTDIDPVAAEVSPGLYEYTYIDTAGLFHNGNQIQWEIRAVSDTGDWTGSWNDQGGVPDALNYGNVPDCVPVQFFVWN